MTTGLDANGIMRWPTLAISPSWPTYYLQLGTGTKRRKFHTFSYLLTMPHYYSPPTAPTSPSGWQSLICCPAPCSLAVYLVNLYLHCSTLGELFHCLHDRPSPNWVAPQYVYNCIFRFIMYRNVIYSKIIAKMQWMEAKLFWDKEISEGNSNTGRNGKIRSHKE